MDINIESNENDLRRDSINVTAVEDRTLIANTGEREKKKQECTLY